MMKIDERLNALLLHEKDNVVTLLQSVLKDEKIVFCDGKGNLKSCLTMQDIPSFHKAAIRKISKGDTVYKYGEYIGTATRSIMPGEHVHTHNLTSEESQ